MKSADEAAARARGMLGTLWPYILGGGNHKGATRVNVDGKPSALGYDCWGFAWSYCYEEPRTVQGFNRGSWSTVSDAINCDSACEEAEHIGKRFQVVLTPRVGDLLVMPSIRDKNNKRIRMGHVWIVVGVPAEWDEAAPQYSLLDTVQCQASSRPAIKLGPGPKSDATSFRGLINEDWRVRILRVAG